MSTKIDFFPPHKIDIVQKFNHPKAPTDGSCFPTFFLIIHLKIHNFSEFQRISTIFKDKQQS